MIITGTLEWAKEAVEAGTVVMVVALSIGTGALLALKGGQTLS